MRITYGLPDPYSLHRNITEHFFLQRVDETQVVWRPES